MDRNIAHARKADARRGPGAEDEEGRRDAGHKVSYRSGRGEHALAAGGEAGEEP